MMNKVVISLRKEYSRLEKEMGKVGKALDALGHAGGKKTQEHWPYLEQRCPQENCRSAETTLGESPKGCRQAGQDLVEEMLRKHRSRPRS
jgi:hypothetical protein